MVPSIETASMSANHAGMGAEGLSARSAWVRRTTSSSVIIGNMARARFVMAGNSEATKLSSTESSSNRAVCWVCSSWRRQRSAGRGVLTSTRPEARAISS